jgi:AraC-like DNA-binding protein
MRGSLSIDRVVEAGLDQEGSPGGEDSILAFSFDWDQHRPWRLNGHVHSGLEISLVLSGRIDLYFPLPGEEVSCRPGEAWVCGVWEPHEWRIAEPGTRSVSLVFSPGLAATLADDDPPYLDLFSDSVSRHKRPVDSTQREALLALGSALARESQQRGPFWQAMARLDLLRILGEYSRAAGVLSPQPPRPGASPGGSSLDRIVPAIRLAHMSPARPVPVARAAAACALSASQFGRVFRGAMGISYAKYCLRVRLALAAHRIVHTESTLDTVAADTGFFDVSHLAKAFARNYGCRPSEYRRRRRHIAPHAAPAQS